MDHTLVHNHSHWGAFSAVVEDGRSLVQYPSCSIPTPRL